MARGKVREIFEALRKTGVLNEFVLDTLASMSEEELDAVMESYVVERWTES